MDSNEISNIKSQMRKGLLEYCILLLLSKKRAYPSDIINHLHKVDMIVVEGTIYTLLNRLKKEGKLQYQWEESPKGPPRKYYFITPAGLDILKVMSDAWDEIINATRHFRDLNEDTQTETLPEQ